MSAGRIMHGSHDGVEVLRYLGDVRYTLCMALDQYLEKLLQRPGLRGFVVDLTAAEGVDSTNLGLLARLARAMQKAGLPRVTLISTQPDINELLTAVGFDDVFDIVQTVAMPLDQMAEIPEASGDTPGRLLLEAHRELMNLNQANRARFQDVVQAFERELESPVGR